MDTDEESFENLVSGEVSKAALPTPILSEQNKRGSQHFDDIGESGYPTDENAISDHPNKNSKLFSGLHIDEDLSKSVLAYQGAMDNLCKLIDDALIQIFLRCDFVSFYRMSLVSKQLCRIVKKTLAEPSCSYPLAAARKNNRSALIQWIIDQMPPDNTPGRWSCGRLDYLKKLLLLNTHIIYRDASYEFFDAFTSYFVDVPETDRLFCFDPEFDLATYEPSDPPGLTLVCSIKAFRESLIVTQTRQPLPLTEQQKEFQRKLKAWQPYAMALQIAALLEHKKARDNWFVFRQFQVPLNTLLYYFSVPQLISDYPLIRGIEGIGLVEEETLRLGEKLRDTDILKAYLLGHRERLCQLIGAPEIMVSSCPLIKHLENMVQFAVKVEDKGSTFRSRLKLRDAYESQVSSIKDALKQIAPFDFTRMRVHAFLMELEVVHRGLVPLYLVLGQEYLHRINIFCGKEGAVCKAKSAVSMFTKRLKILGREASSVDVQMLLKAQERLQAIEQSDCKDLDEGIRDDESNFFYFMDQYITREKGSPTAPKPQV
jgi:hypothetical protein